MAKSFLLMLLLAVIITTGWCASLPNVTSLEMTSPEATTTEMVLQLPEVPLDDPMSSDYEEFPSDDALVYYTVHNAIPDDTHLDMPEMLNDQPQEPEEVTGEREDRQWGHHYGGHHQNGGYQGGHQGHGGHSSSWGHQIQHSGGHHGGWGQWGQRYRPLHHQGGHHQGGHQSGHYGGQHGGHHAGQHGGHQGGQHGGHGGWGQWNYGGQRHRREAQPLHHHGGHH